jgi:hypothetical protein
MSLLSELSTILASLVPVETGVFSEPAPDRYAVITPLVDTFDLYTDDKPRHETQAARISLFDKGNYLALKNKIVRNLLDADFVIPERRYIGHEDDTGYHHFAIDVAKTYELEE